MINDIINELAKQLQDARNKNEKDIIMDQLIDLYNSSEVARKSINKNKILMGYFMQIEGKQKREGEQINIGKQSRRRRSKQNRQRHKNFIQQQENEKKLRQMRNQQQKQYTQKMIDTYYKQQKIREPPRPPQLLQPPRPQQLLQPPPPFVQPLQVPPPKIPQDYNRLRSPTKKRQKEARAEILRKKRTRNKKKSPPKKKASPKKKSPPKKSDSKFARAPPKEEIEKEEELTKQMKKMEIQRKTKKQNAPPGKKPSAPKKKEKDDTDMAIKDFNNLLSKIENDILTEDINDFEKFLNNISKKNKKKVNTDDLDEFLKKLDISKKPSSLNTPSLAKNPVIKKLAATIKDVKTKNAFRNLLKRFKRRSQKKPPVSQKKQTASKETLKIKKPKKSPGKMKAPPNSPDDDWLKKEKKKLSPRLPKKKSPSTLGSNETFDNDSPDIIADQLNDLNINMSPTGTPPEIGNREPQTYSNVMERLTPDSNTPPHDFLHNRRPATPFMKQVDEWGLDHLNKGLDAIDKQLQEEAKKTKTKTNKTRSRK